METKFDPQQGLNEITIKIMDFVRASLDEYFNSLKPNLLNTDVVSFILNLIESLSANSYYLLKLYLPNHELDFDFIKAKMLNALSDKFEDIKKYTPCIDITKDQMNEIIKNGIEKTEITLVDGTKVSLSVNDLYMKEYGNLSLAEDVLNEIKH
jgi:hypothetical protein